MVLVLVLHQADRLDAARRPRPARRRRSRAAPPWRSPAGPEEQKRLTVVAATVAGMPARSAAWRAMLSPVAPSGIAQPRITSSTSAGSTLARVTRVLDGVAGERGAVGLVERAAIRLADRRARGGDDDGIGHGGALPSELVFAERQRAGAAVRDGVEQPRRLRQHMIGVEARRGNLGAVEAVVAALGEALGRGERAACAICQPPETMPISRRNGTAPAATPLASARWCASTCLVASSSAWTPPREARADRGEVAVALARELGVERAHLRRITLPIATPPSRAILRPTRSLAWMPVVPS